MKTSKFNIFSMIRNSENYFLMNLLTGQADILTPPKAMLYKNGEAANDPDFRDKGYYVNPREEESLFRKKYLDFLDTQDKDEVQIFFVPWYSCNFSCDYCFQDGYGNQNSGIPENISGYFFRYIDRQFAGRRKYITLFGGEPLLTGKEKESFILNFVKETKSRKIGIAIVTNGYNLEYYIPALKEGIIREIQVTLDGPQTVHDKRRKLKSGGGTFAEIVRGIDAAMESGFPVNLRMVVDRSNIDYLPDLARFAIEKGWTRSLLFKTQIGRNYELHHCQADNSRLFERAGIYEKIYELVKKYPEILEFHKPLFSISKFLSENGKLPEPLFDACPGTKTEWAFDYTGGIYACTATVGKQGEKLGTFYPEVSLYEEKLEEWSGRNITTIKECRECPVQLVCGGGCAAVARNRTGNHFGPDCNPVSELIEMGIGLYFEKETTHV